MVKTGIRGLDLSPYHPEPWPRRWGEHRSSYWASQASNRIVAYYDFYQPELMQTLARLCGWHDRKWHRTARDPEVGSNARDFMSRSRVITLDGPLGRELR